MKECKYTMDKSGKDKLTSSSILLEEIDDLRQTKRLKKTAFDNNESDSEASISESIIVIIHTQ